MNISQNLKILFWVRKTKANKQGHAPIWVRVTLATQRSEWSTGQYIDPRHWNPDTCEVMRTFRNARAINEFLLLLKADLTKQYNILLSVKDSVTADDIRNSYRGVSAEKRTFFQLFEQYMQQQLERKEIEDLSSGRYKRFEILKGKCEAFVKHKLNKKDVPLQEMKLNFIVEFEHYLRTVQKIGHNTSMKYAKDLKQIMKYGIVLEYIPSSPFEQFHCSYKKVKREFLDQAELDAMYNKKFSVKRLEEVRDCYLFSCYTGYAYIDAESLSPDDITIGIDGEKWIMRNRIKQDNPENVPLLPIPLEIIRKYKTHPYCKTQRKLLPMNSNQRYNAYLKEVADLCGIKKRLTTHTARHTFATTVLLTNDVPMETAMELLGHTDIRTTQIYAKIVQKKVSADMMKLRQKFSNAKPMTTMANNK